MSLKAAKTCAFSKGRPFSNNKQLENLKIKGKLSCQLFCAMHSCINMSFIQSQGSRTNVS